MFYPNRRTLTSVAILSANLVLALISVLLLSRPVRAEFTQEKLTQIVRKAVDDKSAPTGVLFLRKSQESLSFMLGGIKRTIPESGTRTALMYPSDLQFSVEITRQKHYVLAEDGKAEAVERVLDDKEFECLAPYLKEVESIVGQELALIAKHQGKPEDLLKELRNLDREARTKFAEALTKLATFWGLKKAIPLYAAAAAATVEFETNPAGGEIFYLNLADYEDAVEARIIDKKESWFAAGKKRQMNVGDYQFRAYLPDGKVETRKITIVKPKNPFDPIKVVVPGNN
ncbi:MAG TPA: hypothetical protein VKS79_03645 [Gemmataceae bacterium]|nr:hypothetical protein [Gemmataceae bacterium]